MKYLFFIISFILIEFSIPTNSQSSTPLQCSNIIGGGYYYSSTTSKCELCPEGTSCPQGIIFYSVDVNLSGKALCAEGYYQPQKGQSSCLPCPKDSRCTGKHPLYSLSISCLNHLTFSFQMNLGRGNKDFIMCDLSDTSLEGSGVCLRYKFHLISHFLFIKKIY